MKLRHKRKQFWWTFHDTMFYYNGKQYLNFDWGVAKIIHQLKNKYK